METLRELTGQYLALFELADDDDEQAFLDTLEGLNFEIGLKADQYADIIAAFRDKANACAVESERLKRRADRLTRRIDAMKQRLLESMQLMDKKRIDTDYHSFSRRKAGGRQAVEITGDVPEQYCKITVTPDRTLIGDALAAGQELPFAHLRERGEYLKID